MHYMYMYGSTIHAAERTRRGIPLVAPVFDSLLYLLIRAVIIPLETRLVRLHVAIAVAAVIIVDIDLDALEAAPATPPPEYMAATGGVRVRVLVVLVAFAILVVFTCALDGAARLFNTRASALVVVLSRGPLGLADPCVRPPVTRLVLVVHLAAAARLARLARCGKRRAVVLAGWAVLADITRGSRLDIAVPARPTVAAPV